MLVGWRGRGGPHPTPEETPADGPGPDDGADRRPPIAVTELSALLAAGPLDGLRVGVLHGRLAPDEKDQVMLAMRIASAKLNVAQRKVKEAAERDEGHPEAEHQQN